MRTVFIIVGLIILAIAIFAIYRYLTVKRQNSQLNQERFDRIKAINEKLKNGENLTEADILPFAKNILTRQTTYELLNEYSKADLFPKEFLNIEKGAESNLANWLEFPTELDGCPDEMELVKKVTYNIENENVYYYVFKFRINEPHWAAKDGWMLGVVGPYFDDSKPYDFPGGTFSRLSKIDSVSADDEANWVHENIAMRR
jgi:hypothetical protein